MPGPQIRSSVMPGQDSVCVSCLTNQVVCHALLHCSILLLTRALATQLLLARHSQSSSRIAALLKANIPHALHVCQTLPASGALFKASFPDMPGAQVKTASRLLVLTRRRRWTMYPQKKAFLVSVCSPMPMWGSSSRCRISLAYCMRACLVTPGTLPRLPM